MGIAEYKLNANDTLKIETQNKDVVQKCGATRSAPLRSGTVADNAEKRFLCTLVWNLSANEC